MPEVFRTNNPLEYDQLDGVIVTEKNPPPTVVSAGSNNAILIAQFEKGPANTPQFVSSISDLQALFGENQIYGGNKALRLKRFSNLYVTRVVAANAVKSTWTQTVATKDLITLTAKYFGAYGNEITVTIADGTNANTKRFTIQLGDTIETYDNLALAGKSDEELAQIFRNSDIIVATSAHATDEPEDVTNQKLATGSDGTVAPSDYTTAIQASNVNVSGKIWFTDDQSSGVKAALTNFIKLEKAGQCVVGPVDLDTNVADAITDFNAIKDNEGRVIYVYNPLKYNVQGVIEEESPVFMAASVLNLSPPHKSPAAASSTAYTQTAVDTKYNLSRANLILLERAGINAFENDVDLGIKLVTGVTGNEDFSILRRRMSDYYINSVARFLKQYTNEPNSLLNRSAIRAAITAWDRQLVFNGILPGDNEVESGAAFVCRTEGITSDQEKAEGLLKIDLKRRLFASARFLVLVATISEKVVVEEV